MKNHADQHTSTAEWRFDPSPDQLPAARHRLRSWLDDAGVAREVTDDAVLVAAELISNGVLHDGGGAITVRTGIEPGQLRLEVITLDHPADAQPPWLQQLRDPAKDEGGLGMRIVEALTCQLALDHTEGIRRVACAFAVAPDPQRGHGRVVEGVGSALPAPP